MSLTNEQIEARRNTIGGSDMGAILGENNYKTAYEVWEEKVEGKTVDLNNNRAVVIGNLLEDALLTKYSGFTKSFVTKASTLYHKKYKFLSANIDAGAVLEEIYCDFSRDTSINDMKIVEIKTASIFNKDEWGPSGSQIVPRHYYAQIAHYMMVTGYDQADIFVGFIDDNIVGDILCEMNRVIGNIDPTPEFSKIVDKMETRLYTFYRDEEMEALMLESAIAFYEKHMRPWIEYGIKNPPPMDFSNKGFQNCLRKKYSIQEDSEIRLPSEFMKIKNKYVELMLQSKELDKLAQEEKSKIIVAMGNNQKATLDDGSFFSRKTVKRKGFTTKDTEYIKFEFKQPKDSKEQI
jgi:putative phage-type endonuclease